MAKRIPVKMEYILRASPTILFNFLTTPACLIRWFCDEADEQGEFFYFGWNGSVQAAQIVEFIEDEKLLLKWEDAEDENEYLEYKVYRSPITDETIMEITDFCDHDEEKDIRQIWDYSLKKLRAEMGG
jgi:uncharacterized protein YndB with AHSA1/START domain